MNKAIEKVIEECGSRDILAKACGVSNATVGNWLKGQGINGKHIKPISDATGGKVSIDEILQSLSQS
ncbi:antirepressor [Rodentibacter pneumotropicus]|uniref:Helix-turn-helix domain-containing protein n=1 Tax=Rodentibacter pneumotropicus TaxID=758 RepID=A0AAW5LAD7_9PAST|nr:YdaS family helix-turn-helix protein [Rodentibacter pneumotropicus]MCQ9120978.1 helix-turn-helix domain-containing protein [Rodentibacter pneumotropicus]OOF69148.1 antirepressor [Rodentibacter pneumotropicus]